MKPEDGLWEAERMIAIMRYSRGFGSNEDLLDFYDAMVTSRHFCNRWPNIAKNPPKIEFREAKTAFAVKSERRIVMPPWYRNDLYTIHELSHFLQGRERMMHGPVFVGAELSLIERWIGKEAATCFRQMLRIVKVDWIDPVVVV